MNKHSCKWIRERSSSLSTSEENTLICISGIDGDYRNLLAQLSEVTHLVELYQSLTGDLTVEWKGNTNTTLVIVGNILPPADEVFVSWTDLQLITELLLKLTSIPQIKVIFGKRELSYTLQRWQWFAEHPEIITQKEPKNNDSDEENDESDEEETEDANVKMQEKEWLELFKDLKRNKEELASRTRHQFFPFMPTIDNAIHHRFFNKLWMPLAQKSHMCYLHNSIYLISYGSFTMSWIDRLKNFWTKKDRKFSIGLLNKIWQKVMSLRKIDLVENLFLMKESPICNDQIYTKTDEWQKHNFTQLQSLLQVSKELRFIVAFPVPYSATSHLFPCQSSEYYQIQAKRLKVVDTYHVSSSHRFYEYIYKSYVLPYLHESIRDANPPNIDVHYTEPEMYFLYTEDIPTYRNQIKWKSRIALDNYLSMLDRPQALMLKEMELPDKPYPHLVWPILLDANRLTFEDEETPTLGFKR
jgi:hypothetical protein